MGSFRGERISHAVRVGKVTIGGGHPVVIQSMALGGTGDFDKDMQEILSLADEGSELIRVAINSEEAIKAVPEVVNQLVKHGYDEKMIVGCGQYELARLLRDYPTCAAALGKIRVNPGNVGFGDQRDKSFEEVVEFAIKHDMPIRIGVNWGSLDKVVIAKLMDENRSLPTPEPSSVVMSKAMVRSAIESARFAEKIGLPPDRIVLSCKMSRVGDLVSVYKALARESNHALHLGLTEAGSGLRGIVNSVAGISHLLMSGIGDTIRVSLTATTRGERTQEVKVCKEVLQALGLRFFAAQTVSCPGCNRTNFTIFRKLVTRVNGYIESNMKVWKERYPGVVNMTVAVMGCVVNGPGESKHANIGISMPGRGEREVAAVYEDGNKLCTLQGDDLLEKFLDIIDAYVMKKYG
ncbi:flavodoxin-dependent (E)-4-hydroxy-3-methylbut-2-enyl-diphosphate synthase [Candidatus Anaplasma sp. TIGMIC]|uniref:flavodoxin-dependent (E)-4-hydroxy-3-methylbut-2-enyl-diphosphate synthase n=1 Tax=Candidatus Anaplasma sp. TIGMIC TaxID=3020713 RepID=UPI00232CD9BC|nr:flavodoxin-dependent (E)-4-hydroxy-3-methylbut-2-enyl-diphosphate synthase [Candidatus Anaplasma sp. TIGMIC]MDB1135161.1 flavodoxin-dependent (E)-4-hydroxy-3-methylbut-2-enyl-diphosphate synthase [Candidatus Anaplasma sp. TIGMIC]